MRYVQTLSMFIDLWDREICYDQLPQQLKEIFIPFGRYHRFRVSSHILYTHTHTQGKRLDQI